MMALFFPLMKNIKDQTFVVIGNNESAKKKLSVLSGFDVNTFVIDKPNSDIDQTIRNLSPCAVIIADKSLCDAEKIYKLCISEKIEINTVDDPALSTFIFPSIMQKGSLTVAVSTDGACPSAAIKVRRSIEEALPERIDEIIDQLAFFRKNVDTPDKKTALKKLCEAAFEKGSPLTEDEMISILREK